MIGSSSGSSGDLGYSGAAWLLPLFRFKTGLLLIIGLVQTPLFHSLNEKMGPNSKQSTYCCVFIGITIFALREFRIIARNSYSCSLTRPFLSINDRMF